MDGSYRCLQRVGPEPSRLEGAEHQADPLADPLLIPQRPVLLLERDNVTAGIGSRRPPGLVQEDQREQADGFRLGQQVHQEATQGQGLFGEVSPNERLSCRGDISLVVNEVHDLEDGLQAFPKLGTRGNLVGDSLRADPFLGARDASLHGLRSHQEGSRDLFRGEAADLAEREGESGRPAAARDGNR